jgi:hypothetical protein
MVPRLVLRGYGRGSVGGEDVAEVGREGTRLVDVCLVVHGVLEVPHAAGEVVTLAAEVGVDVGEVAEAVLLDHHENANHQEQLCEPVLPLRRVCQQPHDRRLPMPSLTSAIFCLALFGFRCCKGDRSQGLRNDFCMYFLHP